MNAEVTLHSVGQAEATNQAQCGGATQVRGHTQRIGKFRSKV